MKKGKRIMAAVIGAVMLAGMCAGAGRVSAKAEERVYQEKYDAVFEDFDREDISDTVSLTGDAADSGKAFLEVTYGDETMSADDAIYKQAVPGEAGRGNLVIIMRSPDKSASLEDLILGTRYNDSFPVYAKSLAELNDVNLDGLPELTEEYQKYVINFANSYEDSEVYEGSSIQVNSGIMVGFHLYSKEGTSGTIEISRIYFTTDDSDNTEAARTVLNNFVGGNTVDVTANASTATWWCGSATGIIRKRNITLKKDAAAEIVNASNPAGDYRYAVIEAEGDLEHLLVSVHNGEFTEGMAYQDAIAIEGGTDGFRLTATGGDVTIHRIFYTNFEEDVVATEMPYFDPANVQLLDNFNVEQTTINGDYDEMSTRPEVAASSLYYRLSYNNSDKVKVENGTLVFDADALAENDYINFKTESMTPCIGYDYVVLKMKAEDGADLSGFRFGLQDGAIVWGNGGLKSGNGLLIASLADTEYVYRTADGFAYIVVDIEESGLANPESGISVIDMYYSGVGKLYIDEIFFAKKCAAELQTVTICQEEPAVYEPADEGYQYLAYVSAMNEQAAPYLVLRMSGTQGASLDSVRLEFMSQEDQSLGVFWFSENPEGTLRGTDGNLLSALSEEAADYIIDLEKTGVPGNIGAFHIHSGGAAVGGQITLSRVSYAAASNPSYAEIMAALPVYDTPDTQAPVITLDVPSSVAVGDTVKVAASAADDSGDVTIQITVVKDGQEIRLDNSSSFVAEEGVYTVTVKAADAAENEAEEVRQITVTAKEETEPTNTPEPSAAGVSEESGNDSESGEKDSSNTAIIVVCVIIALVAVVAVGAVVIAKKKKEN